MARRMVAPLAAAAILLSGLLAYQLYAPKAGTPDWALQPDNAKIVSNGQAIYTVHCASCHGDNLEGQGNWRQRLASGRLPAPPHDKTGHTWHHDDQALFNVTKFGPQYVAGANYQSDMPGFEGVISDAEIIAALSYIKSTWSADVRATHDEINHRAQITRQQMK